MFSSDYGFIHGYTFVEKDQKDIIRERQNEIKQIIAINEKEMDKLIKEKRSLPLDVSSFDKHNILAKKFNKLKEENKGLMNEYDANEYILNSTDIINQINEKTNDIKVELEACITDKENADQHRLNAFILNSELEEYRQKKNELFIKKELEETMHNIIETLVPVIEEYTK